MDKHHVGGRCADHGPKHELGQNLIRQESRRYGTTKMQSRSPHTRMGDPFLHQICLDEDGPVTEVLTLTDVILPRTHNHLAIPNLFDIALQASNRMGSALFVVDRTSSSKRISILEVMFGNTYFPVSLAYKQLIGNAFSLPTAS